MTQNENKDVNGKKVFFVTQNQPLIKAIKSRLLTMEYEMYFINDYKVLKNLLSEFPDSICFITPDYQLSHTGWKNLIRTLNESPEFKGVKVGIVHATLKQNEIDQFKGGLVLEAGFESIDEEKEDVLKHIVRTLDKLDAKGMRQYVRANCEEDDSSEIYWLEGDKMHKLRILDISSVGIAIELPARNVAALRDKNEIRNAKIILNSRQIPISLDIKMIKPMKNSFIAIAMFKMDTGKAALDLIRTYVSDSLFRDIFNTILNRPIDRTDYDSMVFQAPPPPPPEPEAKAPPAAEDAEE